MQSWKPFLSRLAVGALVVGTAVAGGVLMGVRLASATPGGRTRDMLTYSGVLQGATAGMHPLTFTFQKTGGTMSCAPMTVPAMVATGGAFSVEVPIGACPDFFDGDDITYSVAEGMEMLATGVRIPVPHARFADQAGVTNDCPASYVRDVAMSSTTVTVCYRTIAGGRDEVVKVGTGAGAFWVDRYEARVFGGTGTQYGASDANYPNLAANGQWTPGARGTLLALSRAGGTPSTHVTWFQANALCASAGKMLLSRTDWFLAADGLVAMDPTAALNGNVAGVTGCNTGDNQIGIPSAAIRGGHWLTGPQAGVFALTLNLGPSRQNPTLGFRCVVRR
jgi:hypothetical protein